MTASKPAVFVSYSAEDNQYEDQALSRFRDQLARALRFVSGSTITVIDEIQLGETVVQRLNSTLNKVGVLVPILTPTYLNDPACLLELERFLERERQLQGQFSRDGLVIPVYYQDIAAIEAIRQNRTPHNTNPLIEALIPRLAVDWRLLRHLDFRERQVRTELERIAHRIRTLVDEVATLPAIQDAPPEELPSVRAGIIDTGAITGQGIAIGPGASVTHITNHYYPDRHQEQPDEAPDTPANEIDYLDQQTGLLLNESPVDTLDDSQEDSPPPGKRVDVRFQVEHPSQRTGPLLPGSSVDSPAPGKIVDAHFWGVMRTSSEADTVQSLAFSPDGTVLVSAQTDGYVRIWQMPSGNRLFKLDHQAAVNSVAIATDSKIIAAGSADRTMRLWNATDGTLLHTLTLHEGPVSGVAFLEGGALLASGSTDRTVRLWRISDGALLRTLTSHNAAVTCVAAQDNDNVLASGSADNTIRLWDADGRLLHTLADHTDTVTSVVFAPDGMTLASGARDHTIRIWDVASGELRSTIRAANSVRRIAFSADSTTLASGPRGIRLWRCSDAVLITDSPPYVLSSTLNRPDANLLRVHSVHSLSFSPDGRLLAAGANDGTIYLYQLEYE